MTEEKPLKGTKHRFSLLPYLIASIGILFSLILWYCLKYHPNTPFANYFTSSISHMMLILGTTLSILIATVFRFFKLSREHSTLLKHVSHDFKQEKIKHQHAEETKEQLEKALLQGQKLQAIGTLAGGIAHDFNNILYAIIGFTEMAQEDVEKDSLVYNNLGKVLAASHRGRDLISRILTFSRSQQHGEFKLLFVEQAIESALTLLRATIPASVTLVFHSDHASPPIQILGDPTQLHQVMINVINNAVDAMDSEGTITLSLRRIDTKEALLLNTLPHSLNKNYCRIDLTDTGHGMDHSTMERIFDPFFTTKEVGKGTGLGLATVHSIIKEHEGEIWVNSQLGAGTTFTILLPEYNEQEDDNG